MKSRSVLFAFLLLLLSVTCAAQERTAPAALPHKFALAPNPIELTRAARAHVYFDAVGRKAALLGFESGTFESWVFPLKLFHDARFSVSVEGQDNPVDFAANVARIVARPEATTLIASNQLFTIRAHFLAPIDEPGAIVLLDVDTARPLTITVSFVPDLKPMWPAGLGGQSAGWRDDLKAFVISESRRRYNGLFGCPVATRGVSTPAHQFASGALRFDIKVDPAEARRSFYPLIIAGGTNGRQPVVDLYNRLAATVEEQYKKTFEHYRRLRDEMMSVETPDAALNLAFEWAKVALDKGMVDNPDLGDGLVAGWGASGDGARPGFGWFFGGDAAINSYAMTAYGDFDAVRAALKFLAKYQRADGKIPHEIAQSAGMIKWFDEYPYAYYHADTTPFYIAAVYNYYLQSGDRKLIEELWPALKKAYQFCADNDTDGDGILENSKAGLGASELGSLLNGLHQDIYLAATNLEASTAMVELSRVMNDGVLVRLALERENKAHEAINTRYWNEATGRYTYALTRDGGQNMEVTAWTAVPLMFRQLDERRVARTLSDHASSQLSTDWGVRMLSNRSSAYDPIAYNNGGVWPFLTGFVALGEYAYGRRHSGFAHLKQVAQLTFDDALGYHPEILSGAYYRPLDESVPHQLFSAGMIVTPLVRGLLGLRVDAAAQHVTLAPQLPAAWERLRVKNLRVGAHRLLLDVRRDGASGLKFELEKDAGEPLTVELRPVPPPLARAESWVREIRLERRATASFDFVGGVEIDVPTDPPRVGDRAGALKILDVTTPGERQLVLQVEGVAGRNYALRLRGAMRIVKVDGATAKGEADGRPVFEVAFPADSRGEVWQTKNVTFDF